MSEREGCFRRYFGLSGYILIVVSFCLGSNNVGAADISVRVQEPLDGEECTRETPYNPVVLEEYLKTSATYLEETDDGYRVFDTPRYSTCGVQIEFRGDIDRDSIEILKAIGQVLFVGSQQGLKALILDSKGGNVFAAVDFAEYIRKSDWLRDMVAVVVGECHSACIVILAGAFQRIVDNNFSKVGIHRPHLPSYMVAAMDQATMQRAYDDLYRRLKELFVASNLHPKLVDDMWQIPSDSIKVLSDQELSDYGLSRHDLVVAEQHSAKKRELCGSGASYERDWLDNVIGPCGSNVECVNRLGGGHPYCECFAGLFPDQGIRCR